MTVTVSGSRPAAGGSVPANLTPDTVNINGATLGAYKLAVGGNVSFEGTSRFVGDFTLDNGAGHGTNFNFVFPTSDVSFALGGSNVTFQYYMPSSSLWYLYMPFGESRFDVGTLTINSSGGTKIVQCAEPGSPAAGSIIIYLDSGDGILKVKNSAGVVKVVTLT